MARSSSPGRTASLSRYRPSAAIGARRYTVGEQVRFVSMLATLVVRPYRGCTWPPGRAARRGSPTGTGNVRAPPGRAGCTPTAHAGLTSLSSRFPTYRIASAGHPASAISRWKKLRRRLLHTPAVRRADHINRQVERAQDLLRLCRLVG